MHLDVVNLRGFYYRTELGAAVQAALRAQINALWPNIGECSLAGFGFAAPLLRPYLEKADPVLCLMPSAQGVMQWPQGEANRACLVPEFSWPITTASLDRVIVIHGLETSDNPSALLSEVSRVLAPSGRVIFIVPNRMGLWSRSDRTPFGYGRPYSLGQLEAQLKEHEFYVERHRSALYAPPRHRSYGVKLLNLIEQSAKHVTLPLAAGVHLVEASKQVFAPTRPGLAARIKRPLSVIGGLRQPIPRPTPNANDVSKSRR